MNEIPTQLHLTSAKINSPFCRTWKWNTFLTSWQFFLSTSGTSTVEFSGDNFISIDLKEEKKLEVHDISLRFRTMKMAGLLLLASSQETSDALEIGLEGGQVKIKITIEYSDKEFSIGQSLNDDIWHTLTFKRRGNTIEANIDDENSRKGKKSVWLEWEASSSILTVFKWNCILSNRASE